MEILRNDLARRLIRLDPTKRFRIIHGEEVKSYLGDCWDSDREAGPITITFAVGGAGAQAEIAGGAVKSLSNMIKQGKVRLNLVAAHREEVKNYFEKLVKKHGLTMSEGIGYSITRTKTNISASSTNCCMTRTYCGPSRLKCRSTAAWDCL